jgi:hypothetical protein
MRRELADLLFDLVDSLAAAESSACRVTPTRLSLAMPMEVRLRDAAGAPTLFAEPPMRSWATSFDDRPATLRVTFEPLAHLLAADFPPAEQEAPE